MSLSLKPTILLDSSILMATEDLPSTSSFKCSCHAKTTILETELPQDMLHPFSHLSFPHELLPRDIESAMCQVIEKEINLQRRLESLKSDLAACLDYSAFAAFNSVERFTRTGVLTTVNIGEFLRTQGHFASETELVAIVRRIDTNGDCSISSGELAEFLRPLGGVKTVITSSPVRYSSPVRTSPIRYSSPVRVRTATLIESPVSLNRSLSVERRYSPVYVSPSRYVYDPVYPASYYSRYPYYSKYYPYSPLYASKYYPYGSYYSPTLGRYVAY